MKLKFSNFQKKVKKHYFEVFHTKRHFYEILAKIKIVIGKLKKRPFFIKKAYFLAKKKHEIFKY